MVRLRFLFAALLVLAALSSGASARDRWTAEAAHKWYAHQPWMVGSNYTPANAINELEMWQGETFDPARIDLEFGWAEHIGMNTMRVFLHNLVWEKDAAGFKQRINTFLGIADKHHIKILFVLFDSCWDPNPVLGPQHPPIPGVHNSGWVQAPGADRLKDTSQYGKLEAYVKDIVGTFGKDSRVVVWDVWNEPSNDGGGNYAPTPDKQKYVAALLPQVFQWARSADPIQPLTSGVWIGDNWGKDTFDRLPAIERTQLSESDIISFHDYSWPEMFDRRVAQLKTYGRPLICTEYMARGNGSTFDGTLPRGHAEGIAMYNWGFVDGKTQTRLPWDSWKKPYTGDEPPIWFHEVFHTDGTPYRQAEVDLIKSLSTKKPGARK